MMKIGPKGPPFRGRLGGTASASPKNSTRARDADLDWRRPQVSTDRCRAPEWPICEKSAQVIHSLLANSTTRAGLIPRGKRRRACRNLYGPRGIAASHSSEYDEKSNVVGRTVPAARTS